MLNTTWMAVRGTPGQPGQRRAWATLVAAGALACLAGLAPGLAAQTAQFSWPKSTVVSGLSNALGVTVDGSGNVYVADSDSSAVYKYAPDGSGGYTRSTIGGDLSPSLENSSGVAVDAGGNVYIADTTNNRVLKETPNGSGYTQSVIANSSTNGLNTPYGVAVDGSGNVYVADTDNSAVKEIDRAGAPSLSFASSIANSGDSSDSPQTVTVENIGNQPLTIEATPAVSTNFALDTNNGCTSGDSVAAGSSCALELDFAPTEVG